METKLLSGNEAIAQAAYEAGVAVAAGYPGTPSTEILETLSRYRDELYCEWAPNEKVAMEMAAGAALAGVRTIVTMKHVGLNVAADPLMTLAYLGVNGGMVICVADDPGMHSSQNEQDTRNYARFAKIPLLEPSDSREAFAFTKFGLELSERYKTPVLLRTTTAVSHSRAPVEVGAQRVSPAAAEFVKEPPRYVPVPVWGRPMRVRLEERLSHLQSDAQQAELNRVEWREKSLGIITSGIVYQYVREAFPQASVLKLGWSFPFPDTLIREFAAGVDQVLVVEELDNFLEEHVRSLGIACSGRDLVPGIGELSSDILRNVRLGLEGKPAETVPEPPACCRDLPARAPVLCAGCPHRGIFYALGEFDVIVTGDIGCYTLGTFPPLNRLDTVLCMGGGISLAHGIERAGNRRKVIGMVGDSTFFHSGVTGLVDIVYNGGKAAVIVLDNHTTAMTGHQCHPGTGRTLMGTAAPELSIEDLGRACGIKNVATVNPYNLEEVRGVLKQAVAAEEPWLIVSRAVCPLYARKKVGPVLSIDPERCVSCRRCLKLGCPAIECEGGTPRINALLCAGCGLCRQVCPTKACEEKGEESCRK
ncbi:MAG: indolepyruvate ferredoxin oxidoreductase subunit alpha [Deltaproteobacteria bacterium]|nr:indolepyruvate ferredoxin oxidoreductase subunit alpha [Deltaproteobacteria bacterium]